MRKGYKDNTGVRKDMPRNGKTFPEMCHLVGKSGPYVHNLQSKLGLYIPAGGDGYSNAYIIFLQTIISLRTFSIPLDDVCQLFETEKKLLKLLKVDSLTQSKTWYLDACNLARDGRDGKRLLLTNHEIDLHIKPNAIQSNLDFGAKEKELFSGHEMGEDARKVYDVYRRQRDEIMSRVQDETCVLERALDWLISVSP